MDTNLSCNGISKLLKRIARLKTQHSCAQLSCKFLPQEGMFFLIGSVPCFHRLTGTLSTHARLQSHPIQLWKQQSALLAGRMSHAQLPQSLDRLYSLGLFQMATCIIKKPEFLSNWFSRLRLGWDGKRNCEFVLILDLNYAAWILIGSQTIESDKPISRFCFRSYFGNISIEFVTQGALCGVDNLPG